MSAEDITYVTGGMEERGSQPTFFVRKEQRLNPGLHKPPQHNSGEGTAPSTASPMKRIRNKDNEWNSNHKGTINEMP